jgi:hypothetical protein
MASCILSMGHDPDLMIVRTLILRRAGYVVEEVRERDCCPQPCTMRFR